MLRFLADSNVGRLARWLRAYGYDAAYAPHVDDRVLIARALAEGRVLLTRDAGLVQRRVVTRGTLRAVLLASDRVADQLRQVVEELGLAGDHQLTRCLECNVELEPRAKAEVSERLPPYVRATQTRFSECPGCGRVYWPGTHWERMSERLAAL
ncbi:MAG: Mut7-C RNAse domain-containing protein [Candidatus Dormibacteraeota bacterium]|jgi:uncharacterized protein|nr:Mut7-C RNAse domain-containing protein [Candidatus Dormibacteraeota bacterium]MDQ6921536.1 Mut7-C RNAse domain-containing protein [Candidatus Dormibacteraeota bacterium]